MKPATESLTPPGPSAPSEAPLSTSQPTTAVQRITLKGRRGPAEGVPSSGPVPLHPGTPARTLEYVGRVQVVEPERGLSTLMITDLRDIDSAEYRFTFTSRGFEWRSDLPGTTLTISGAGKTPATFTFALTAFIHSVYRYIFIKDKYMRTSKILIVP